MLWKRVSFRRMEISESEPGEKGDFKMSAVLRGL
jgi:hypothetical protein